MRGDRPDGGGAGAGVAEPVAIQPGENQNRVAGERRENAAAGGAGEAVGQGIAAGDGGVAGQNAAGQAPEQQGGRAAGGAGGRGGGGGDTGTARRRPPGGGPGGGRKNGEPDLDEKFGRFEIKPPPHHHGRMGGAGGGGGHPSSLSEQGDETVSMVSDTWSTDVLASDTETLPGEAMEGGGVRCVS